MKASQLSLLIATAAVALATPVHAAFTSASGVPPPPGSSQSNPLYPSFWISASGSTSAAARFDAPQTNQWFSTPDSLYFWLLPVGTNTVTARLSSGSFSNVTAPAGFGTMQLRVGGVVVDNDFNVGEAFSFVGGVNDFQIVVGSYPATGQIGSFQMKLGILGSPSTMTWTTAVTAAVPETSTFALTLLGIVGVGLLLGGRRQKPS
jgi:hypothetical protein